MIHYECPLIAVRAVAQRFREAGMDVQQIAARMDVSPEFATSLL